MHFLGYVLILPLHQLPKREHSEDVSHWGGCGEKTRFLGNQFIPEWGRGENTTTPTKYLLWEARSLLWDPYWLRSSETWYATRNMGGCWQEYVFCVAPRLSSTTEWEHWYHLQWCGWLLWKTLFPGLHIIPEWCRGAQSLHRCIVTVEWMPW